jgi:hypothetical protein|tara:strand:- start:5610 stop:5804 length:195 start_codon:yes stop_codon:yes gene_type:complete
MRWEELSELLLDRGQENPEFLEEQVFVWDVSTGEFYPADTLDTQESDGIIDANRLFISIREDEI